MEFGPQWIVIIFALVLGSINLVFPARSARFRRRSDTELEARIEAARDRGNGEMAALGSEIGIFKRWIYRDYFYPQGARLMAAPYLAVALVLISMG